jgi:hypothetical protein
MKICRSLALALLLPALALAAAAQETTPPKESTPPPASTPPAETAAKDETPPKDETPAKDETPPKDETPAAEAALPGDGNPYELEVGFRTLQISGNEGMYRTQINERSGLLLRSFTLLTNELGGSSRFFDRLRVDAADLGAGPAGSLRIEADKRDRYRFRLAYRHSNAFSALPAFANPLLGQGVLPGQHTYDRTRNALEADLELLPGRNVTPFIGVSVHRLRGPGMTTYTLGGDDFRLSQQLEESEQELRLGTGFNLGWLYGSVMQGWRRARGSELLTLAATDGSGNSTDPLLGHPVLSTGLTREDRTRVNTPFSSFYVTGQLGKRARVVIDYVRFAADSSADLTESAAGSFVSFALSRYFNGLSETGSSSAKNKTWRGGGRVEVALRPGIVAFAGYQKDHRDLEGSALIETLYLQTLTFGGVDPRDVQIILNAKSALARDEDVASVGASARALGPFAVRIEIREAKQSLTVAPDLSEIVVPGSQGGDFERRIRTLDTNASYTKSGFSLGAAYRHDQADAPIFRTDFRNRDRLRLRAGWAGTTSVTKWIRAGVTAEETKQRNDRPGIELEGSARQASGDIEVTPHEGVVFRASLSRFRADNRIVIRRPENFNTEPSLYAEDGRSGEGGVAVNVSPFSFDVSAARFLNRGANPFEIQRIRVRVGFELPAKTRSGLIAEYAKDKYREPGATYADFNARRFGLFIRYRP